MLHEHANDGPTHSRLEAIGNLDENIGLSTSPVAHQELLRSWPHPIEVESIDQMRNRRVQKLAEVFRLGEQLAQSAIGEIAEVWFFHGC
jgi:hypothetical protein